MPRPTVADDLSQNRADRSPSKESRRPSKDSTSKDVAETARSFERHLKGLAAAFNKLHSQHQHEHLQAVPPPLEIPKISCISRPSGMHIEKQFAIRRASERSQTNGKAIQDLLATMDSSGTNHIVDDPEEETSPHKGPDDMMHKQFQAQFRRLDKAGNGHLEEEDLMAVMHDFNRGWELQDIHQLFHEINRLVKSSSPKSSPHAVPHASSARTLTRPHEYIDMDGFLALVSEDQLVEGPNMTFGIRRDCKILREALKAENNYNLYKDDGHWTQGQKIKGPTGKIALVADVVPGFVIVMNALVLGISSDVHPNHDVWLVFNYFFLAFYSLEFLIKIALFGWRWFFLGHEWAWNIFDFFCLTLSWLEEVITWILTSMSSESVDLNTMVFIRMLRLTRLVRLVRTLRFEVFYELKMMVFGVYSGMRVLFWAMVLLVVIIYTTGVAAKNVFGPEEAEFETVPAAMFTLFRCFTDGCNAYDGTPLMERLRPKYGLLFVISYVCMFMLVCLGVFNLIMAIFIENVMVNQLQRKLSGIDNTQNRMEVMIKEHLLRLVLRSRNNGVPEEVEQELKAMGETFHRRDARVRAMFETLASSQVVITKPAFLAWLQDKDFISVLKEADIETANQVGIFECLDADMSGWLTMDEIYNGLMRLRGPVAKTEIVGFCLRLRHVAQLVHGMSD